MRGFRGSSCIALSEAADSPYTVPDVGTDTRYTRPAGPQFAQSTRGCLRRVSNSLLSPREIWPAARDHACPAAGSSRELCGRQQKTELKSVSTRCLTYRPFRGQGKGTFGGLTTGESPAELSNPPWGRLISKYGQLEEAVT
ncbi:hypothetical protein Bbelb_094070 [Branchiostoma belcheri]|nr:hypothetical protein Bbelb_094070 [Branchiostoma belcheri]